MKFLAAEVSHSTQAMVKLSVEAGDLVLLTSAEWVCITSSCIDSSSAGSKGVCNSSFISDVFISKDCARPAVCSEREGTMVVIGWYTEQLFRLEVSQSERVADFRARARPKPTGQ